MHWKVSASPPTMQDDEHCAYPKDEACSPFLCTTANLHIGGYGAQCEPSTSARTDDAAVLLRNFRSLPCEPVTKSTIGQILLSVSANAPDVTAHNKHYCVT